MENIQKRFFAIRPAYYFAILAAFCFCFSTPLYAQMGMSESCPSGGSPSSGNRGDGDDIQCRINNMLNSNQNLVTTMKGKMGSCSGAHCDLIMDHLNVAQAAAGRAMKANGRMKGDDYSDLNIIRRASAWARNPIALPETTTARIRAATPIRPSAPT